MTLAFIARDDAIDSTDAAHGRACYFIGSIAASTPDLKRRRIGFRAQSQMDAAPAAHASHGISDVVRLSKSTQSAMPMHRRCRMLAASRSHDS